MRKLSIILLMIMGSVMIHSCNGCTGQQLQDACNQLSPPVGLIADTEAKTMHDNYKSRFQGENTEVRFTIDEIKSYLCMIDKKADSLNVDNLGLRIYFGRTTDGANGENTVMLVPTYMDNNGTHQDFCLQENGINQVLNMGTTGTKDLLPCSP